MTALGQSSKAPGQILQEAGKDFVDERQLFPQDDQDDSELFEKLQEHVREKYPNPERIGCIDKTTLETWVCPLNSIRL